MTSSRLEGSYKPISDYGLISDMHSSALVDKDGSIDWCCLPRFDSAAVFSRLLDSRKGGYFQVAPRGVRSVSRRYLPGTNVLETLFETDSGMAKLTDFMPAHHHSAPEGPHEAGSRRQLVRILECVSGSVRFFMECYPRFDYGTIIPHASLDGPHKGFAHGGADGLLVYCSAPMREAGDGFQAEGLLRTGEKLCAAVAYQYRFSYDGTQALDANEAEQQLEETVRFWQEWAGICTYQGEYRDDVLRSALGDQGPDLRAIGRSGCGTDHLFARGCRWLTQLGLSLHVDSGRIFRPLRSLYPGLQNGSPGVQGVARVEHRGACQRPSR